MPQAPLRVSPWQVLQSPLRVSLWQVVQSPLRVSPLQVLQSAAAGIARGQLARRNHGGQGEGLARKRRCSYHEPYRNTLIIKLF